MQGREHSLAAKRTEADFANDLLSYFKRGPVAASLLCCHSESYLMLINAQEGSTVLLTVYADL